MQKRQKLQKGKRWCRSVLAILFIIGMLFMEHPYEVYAGSQNYTATITSTTSGDNITFTCNLSHTVDGQTTSYQWQEYNGSSWSDISGATGSSYTVSMTGREGYQYRCNVDIKLLDTYSLMHDAYKAFHYRDGSVPEYQSWWPNLYDHTSNEYVQRIVDLTGYSDANEAARVVMEMVFSLEYTSKYSNTDLSYTTSPNSDTQHGPRQLIVDCFRFLLQREPSDAEIEYWYGEYANNNNNGNPYHIDFRDAGGNWYSKPVYKGMAHVIVGIADSAECAQNMAAHYHYNGDLRVFLYTDSDEEERPDSYNIYSDTASIPVTTVPTYNLRLYKGIGIESVSGGGEYTAGQTVTINASVKQGYHWKNWTGTYTTETMQYTFTMPASDVTLTANGEANNYTIQYAKGQTNWSGTVPGNTSCTYNSDVTLRGIGNIKGRSYTLNFDSNKGNGSSEPTTLNSQTGYLIGTGWKIESTNYSFGQTLEKPNFTTANNGSVTATAQWQTKTLNNFGSVSRTGYEFDGWYDAPSGGNKVTYVTVAPSTSAFSETLYAQWEANKYTIEYEPGDTDDTDEPDNVPPDTPCDYDEDVTLPDIGDLKGRSYVLHFDSNKGNGSSEPTTIDSMSGRLTADGWVINNGVYEFGTTLIRPNFTAEQNGSVTATPNWQDIILTNFSTVSRDGYVFVGWYDAPEGGNLVTSVTVTPDKTAYEQTLYAHWEAYTYTIKFDPNDGAEETHIDDMVVTYDQDIMLPDGAAYYKKYTLDGVNVTEEVLSGAIVLDALGNVIRQGEPLPEGSSVLEDGTIVYSDGTIISPEGIVTYPDGNVVYPDGTAAEPIEENVEATGADAAEESVATQTVEELEETEELKTEPEPDQDTDPKAYASIFLGWALDEHKFDVAAQWNAQETISVNDLVEAAGVVDQNGATMTLYAVWDDCPWIQATDLYYTLEQAQSGYITEAEILSHALASDREDGSPIAPGVHDNGTSFTIPDYQATDFTQFQHDGSCTENLTVVDSAGSTYSKQITVYIVDTTPVAVKPEGTTRFINEYYYNQSYENGGLEDNSIWKTDPDYAAALIRAFENSKNDTPIQTFRFTHEEILQMQEFVQTNGVGNTQREDALTIFYDQFLAPNLQ